MYNFSSKFLKNTNKNHISVLINLIISQYFNNSRCLIILTDYSTSHTYISSQQLIQFSWNTTNSSFIFDHFITDGYHGCQNILIDSVKPIEMFEKMEKGIVRSLARFNERKYLFVLKNYEMNMNELFKLKALTYVADLVIVNAECNEIFKLWSHDYVGEKNNNFLRIVDTWFSRNLSFWFGNELYPNKLRNQHGRVIRIACFKYIPYSLCDPDLLSRSFYGMELKLVAEYVKCHNLTPYFVFNDVEEDYWGALYPNWTGSGLLGKLLNDKADIVFSAFYTWEFVYHYLDLSKSYIRTGISCLVPKPRMYRGWFIPISPYKSSMWIAVFISITCNIAILFVATKIARKLLNPSDILNNGQVTCLFFKNIWIIVKITIGQTLGKKEMNVGVKLVVLVLILEYSVLDCAYYSGLASTMTVPRYKNPINTAADLANSDVKIWGLFEDWTLSIKNIDNEIYNKITHKYRAVDKGKLRELTKHDSNAFFLERLPYNNYGINDFMKADVIKNYHLMEEDVYWEYTLFYLRKSSILTKSFDEFLLRVIESGLPYVWQKKAVYEFMDLNIQKLADGLATKNAQHVIVKLKFLHIKGSLAVLLIGIVLSVFTLAVEMCVYYRKRE